MAQIGILKSSSSRLASLVPSIALKYQKDGHSIALENGAVAQSFYLEEDYKDVLEKDRNEILTQSDILLTADNFLLPDELQAIKPGTILIGRFNKLTHPKISEIASSSELNVFGLDMVPRTSIAQTMDILSSLASLSGYKAVLEAANHFPGYFPMMTTAAGTVPPAKVLVLGAGVAGLQAIATAKRLGAVVEAFDVRSAVKEEVESLGAKFVEVEGSTEDSGAGGYAVEQSEEYKQKQQSLIQERAIKSDIVISTANIPGRKAPILLQQQTIEQMKPGCVIVDMATASGGNCDVSVDNQVINHEGITIIGDSSLYEKLPKEASRLYSTNLYNFLKFVLKDGIENLPWEHEILTKTALNRQNPQPVTA
ncbi:MAG: NAD(P) transhydrogenase subunit alpha [Cyclobacteriaceae bacterium]